MLETLKRYREGLLWKRLLEISPRSHFNAGSLLQPFEYPEPIDLNLFDSGKGLLIHHYTGVEGLKGIIESNKLHATAAYYLNDSSEVEYGSRMVLEVLEEWLDLNRDNRAFAAEVLRTLYAVFRLPETPSIRSQTIEMN